MSAVRHQQGGYLGLFVVTYLAIRSEAVLELAHLMGWIGMLTTVAGAVMALQQEDVGTSPIPA